MTERKVFTSIDRMFFDMTDIIEEMDEATIISVDASGDLMWGFGCVELDVIWLIKLSDFNRNLKCKKRIHFRGKENLLKRAIKTIEGKEALAGAFSGKAGRKKREADKAKLQTSITEVSGETIHRLRDAIFAVEQEFGSQKE